MNSAVLCRDDPGENSLGDRSREGVNQLAECSMKSSETPARPTVPDGDETHPAVGQSAILQEQLVIRCEGEDGVDEVD